MRNLKQKWIAWLAVVCMLATLIPAAALVASANSEPIFSELVVQFIGRLPSNDPKNGVFVSLSNDGETWTDPVAYNGHGMDVWGCSNEVNPAFLGTIDVTEQAKALTSDKFFVKLGMGAGDISWTVLHQVRIAGTYTGQSEQTEFFWDDYSKLPAFARNGANTAEAAANVVETIPHIVSANLAFLQQCNVDHQATGLSPYHGGYYGEPENVNGHVVYAINQEIQPEEPSEKVYFEFFGRMPGDVNGANKVQVMVGSDGQNWTEAALLEGNRDDHSDSTYFKVDITHAVDLSANNLYVKMNLIAYLAEWCSARQIRVTKVAADGTEATLMHVIYDDMAIGSEDYKSGLYVDGANMQLRGTYDPAANDPSGLTMNEDCDGQDGKGLGDNYVTYKIVLKDEPVEPPVVEGDKVFFEVFGRLPGDVNGANKVQVMVGADGQNWTEATVFEGPRDDHGDSTYAKIDITHAVDLSANNLYVKMNLIAYLAEWYSVRQIRVTKVAADGTETTLMHVIYDDMAIGSEDYKSGLYVDGANVQLRGTYDPAANDPSGLTVKEDCDGQDGKGLGDCYVTYKIVLKDEPVTPPVDPDVPVDPEDKYILNDLSFEYLGRLPENGEGKNKVHVALSKDGENWTEIYILNPFADASGNAAWLGGQYSGEVDLSAAAAEFLGTELTDLYVRIGLNAGINNWCAVEQIRFNGKVNGGEKAELLYEKYDEMLEGGYSYRSAKYIDSDMIRLSKISYDGAYMGMNPQPDGKIMTLQPNEPFDPADPKPYRCYITYKLLGDVDPDEVTPEPEPDNPGGGEGGDVEVLGNEINKGYFVDFNKMENGATDWHTSLYDISAMKVFYDKGDNYTMLCPDSSKNYAGIGYVTYKVTAPEGETLGLLAVTMNGRVFDLDADESRGLTVEYSLDGGTTWQLSKHFASTTTGRKDQGYAAGLGIIDQNSVLIRIKMSSGMNDWVGLTDLKIQTPNSVPVGFFENFDGMLPGSKKWQNNAYSFNMMTVYSSEEGYNSLTTNQNVTDRGLGYVEYLIQAEEGKKLDGLKVLVTGRIYDFDNDANRGLTITCSDDFGKTYYAGARVAAGENSIYDQEYVLDLSAAAAGKTALLVRIETNTKFWDWVCMQSIEFVADDYTPPVDPDEPSDPEDPEDPVDPDEPDAPVTPDEPGTDSPETGDTWPYATVALLMVAAAAAFILRKKQTN